MFWIDTNLRYYRTRRVGTESSPEYLCYVSQSAISDWTFSDPIISPVFEITDCVSSSPPQYTGI
jgi:hypothetical protein